MELNYLEGLKKVIELRAWKNGKLKEFISTTIDNKKMNLELVDDWFIKKHITKEKQNESN